MTTGVLLCGHGTRHRKGLDEFERLCQLLDQRLTELPTTYGYLEFARPIIRDGLDQLRKQGCTTVHALPAMLFAAGHVKNDIPSILNAYQKDHPEMRITLARELALTPKMLAAAAARAQEALATSSIPAEETLLLVVGRGASDPDANGNIAKIARMLCEGLGCGWAEVAYSGLTFPLVQPALERLVLLPFQQIVVVPYFLFDGVLVQRIYEQTDSVAAQHPKITFLKAPYLSFHPAVIDTFLERLAEIHTPENSMNCQLCKYRSQIVGFEDDVGRAQESHHHHVEGGGGNGHTHDHTHEHTHPPYPQANHPLGPRSLKAETRQR
ncbi:MAG: sirohydrochlorin chelatase [Alphaproteobacteria bacterium GM202ARS2]|nr:sirohydrochlorin chelatase [Alphaproteobacteria bacterium GM202ARS2]